MQAPMRSLATIPGQSLLQLSLPPTGSPRSCVTCRSGLSRRWQFADCPVIEGRGTNRSARLASGRCRLGQELAARVVENLRKRVENDPDSFEAKGVVNRLSIPPGLDQFQSSQLRQ